MIVENVDIKTHIKEMRLFRTCKIPLNKVVTSAPKQFLIFYHISCKRANRQYH